MTHRLRWDRRFRPRTLQRVAEAVATLTVDTTTHREAARRAGVREDALYQILRQMGRDWTRHPALRVAVVETLRARGMSDRHIVRVTGMPVKRRETARAATILTARGSSTPQRQRVA